MKTTLTSEQWDAIEQKYGNLMYTICKHISGDHTLCSVEDLRSDLNIIAIEAVETFRKKNTQSSFEEFFNSKGFDRYIKSCLWNYKANRGSKITKKKVLYSNLSIESNFDDSESFADLDLNFRDKSSASYIEMNVDLEEFMCNMSDYQKHLVSVIVENPDLIKPNGKINRLELSGIENKHWTVIDKEIGDLSKRIGVPL